jgi:amidase
MPDVTMASWKTIAAAKRQSDMAKIPTEWRLPRGVIDDARQHHQSIDGFLDRLLQDEDPDCRALTNLEAPTLMAMTANGSLTAIRLVTAFCKRAAYAHQLVSHTPTSVPASSSREGEAGTGRAGVG